MRPIIVVEYEEGYKFERTCESCVKEGYQLVAANCKSREQGCSFHTIYQAIFADKTAKPQEQKNRQTVESQELPETDEITNYIKKP